MISNDITISLNELFKYFDTVNVSGFRRDTSHVFFGVILVTRFSAHQYTYMYTLERDKQLCQEKKRKRISKCSVFSTLLQVLIQNINDMYSDQQTSKNLYGHHKGLTDNTDSVD